MRSFSKKATKSGHRLRLRICLGVAGDGGLKSNSDSDSSGALCRFPVELRAFRSSPEFSKVETELLQNVHFTPFEHTTASLAFSSRTDEPSPRPCVRLISFHYQQINIAEEENMAIVGWAAHNRGNRQQRQHQPPKVEISRTDDVHHSKRIPSSMNRRLLLQRSLLQGSAFICFALSAALWTNTEAAWTLAEVLRFLLNITPLTTDIQVLTNYRALDISAYDASNNLFKYIHFIIIHAYIRILKYKDKQLFLYNK